jgi:uncharacterized protein YvpB
MARSRPGRWSLATSVSCFALTCLALAGCALSPADPPAPIATVAMTTRAPERPLAATVAASSTATTSVAATPTPTSPPRVPLTATAAVLPRIIQPTAILPTVTPTPLPAEQLLTVPLHKQEHALSCEAAALKMAMGALGIDVPEDALLSKMSRDRTPRVVRPDGTVQWGDPDIGFIGRWDGVFARDGYGVYDGPIAELAVSYGFSGTTHAQGVDPEQLYDAVRQGYPSVVWMPYGLTVKGRGAWSTPKGKHIDYVVTEHAVVLAGVDARGVVYADPYTASLEHASFGAFEAAMAELGDRAVTVRP